MQSICSIVFIMLLLCPGPRAKTLQDSTREANRPPGTRLQTLRGLSPEAALLYERAEKEMDAGRLAEAHIEFEQVLQLAYEFPDALRNLGLIAALQDDHQQAEKYMLRALAKERSQANLIALARLYLTMNEKSGHQKAGELLLEARALQSDDPSLLQIVAHTGFILHDRSLWWPAIDRLKHVAPRTMKTHYYSAQAAIRDGDLDQARIELALAQRLGYPPQQAQLLLSMWENGIPVPAEEETKASLNELLPLLKYLFLFWISGLLLLFTLSAILSRLILHSLAKENFGQEDVLGRKERWLRSVYRRAIEITAIYYYISMPFIVLLTIAVGAALLYLIFSIGRIPIHFALLVLFAVLYTLYALVRTLFIKVIEGEPQRTLDEQQAPAFWSLLRNIAATLRTRPIDAVYLTSSAKIAVMERGSVMQNMQGRAERCLMLGIAALHGMTRRQFSAIIAHEYGHFVHQDTAGGHLAIQVSASIHVAADALALKGMARWYNPGWLFINGFYRIFLRVTLGASRLQEYLADRYASTHYGVTAFSEGLLHLAKRSIEFNYLCNWGMQTSLKEKQPIANLYQLQVPPDSELQKNIDSELVQLLNLQAGAYDSHPSLKERFARLAHLPEVSEGENDQDPAWNLLPNQTELEESETLRIYEYMIHQLRLQTQVERAQVFPGLPELVFLVKIVSTDPAATRLIYRPPLYSTDPRQFYLPEYAAMSDSEFAPLQPSVRAFPDREDAIQFARMYDTGLVQLLVYRKQELDYMPDEEAGEKFRKAVMGEKIL